MKNNTNNMKIPLLTKGESKVYCALNELGESTVGDIIKISGVSHSKIYDVLKRLSKKGIVSSINKNNKQYFSSAEPKYIIKLIEQEQSRLDKEKSNIRKLIKRLNIKRGKTTPKSPLSSFEGSKGMKIVLEMVLDRMKKDDFVFIIGSPKKILQNYGAYIKEWQKKRIAMGIKCKIIADGDAPSWLDNWWMESKKNKLTFTKHSTSVAPSYLIITKKIVATIHVSENILSFLVENEDVAKRYITFFHDLWKIN